MSVISTMYQASLSLQNTSS